MNEFLSSSLVFLSFLPGMLLAYLPMKQYLRIPPVKLAVLTFTMILLFCITGGTLSCFLSINTRWLFFPFTVTAGVFYVNTVKITYWKSISVFLSVCGALSSLGGATIAINSVLHPENATPSTSIGAAVAYDLICCAYVIVLWYPSTHAARALLEEKAVAQTWYVFWILPLLFIGLNVSLISIQPKILNQGHMIWIYIITNLALLLLLLLFYMLFYGIATSLNKNDRLRQENQFLSMQQARYDNLCTVIAETREARHDMRHHFHALQNLAMRRDWESLEKYLADACKSIPDTELNLCDNSVVDGVASHYGLLFRKQNIPFSFELDLPAELPVPEIDLCLVLSNLLENALEASLKTKPQKQRIKVQAYLHSEHMVLLTVTNAFDGDIKEKDGVFQSSKHRGEGVGIQSIRRIAKKNGGYSRFLYEDGMFYANVMLRAGK